MTSPADHAAWADANQRYLVAMLAGIRQALERRGAVTGTGDRSPTAADGAPAGVSVGASSNPAELSAAPEPQAIAEAEALLPGPAALDVLTAAFGLSRFERDLLLLCAGPDLDSRFPRLLAAAHGDPNRRAPTFGLALGLLVEPHWSALLPGAPLRHWHLLELGPGDSLTSSPLRLDEWALHFLAGTPHLDPRLAPFLRPVPEPTSPSPALGRLGERLATEWRKRRPTNSPLRIELRGDSLHDQLAVAGQAASLLGCAARRLAGVDLPGTIADRDLLARLWEREIALNAALLVLDLHELDSGDALRPALDWVETLGAPVILLTREPLPSGVRPRTRLEVPRATATEQHAMWQQQLRPVAGSLNGEIERVAGQFCLEAQAIREIASELTATPATRASATAPTQRDGATESLWQRCRHRSRVRIEAHAQRLEPQAGWEDLVLPAEQVVVLRDIARHVRHRFRVYEEWGFAAKGSRGLGISALFAGGSGTGKTLAAEVVARELELDLFRIDLSAVVSKYIGETEKNLRRIFDAAEAGGAVLLFDEADALFGKRSEVKDSHDRYANIEVSYLLQRLETYRGLAILTTNFKQALDLAFLRRLRFVVQFPFPDATHRAEIWRRVFPAATPREDLDLAKLARLNVTGGHIRNIALQAAFLAAEARAPVRMEHLLQAARSECAKLERPPSEAELRGWV
jgi:hypothetical protein